MSLQDLRVALPQWVTVERHAGTPVVKESALGAIASVEVMAYPEAPPAGTMAADMRANVHFMQIAPTEGFPDREVLIATVVGALGQGEFQQMTAEGLAEGPSFIALGAWLGSQELALMLIGAVGLAGIADPITPAMLGIEGEQADQMAGLGFVLLGPWQGWAAA